MIEAKPLLTYAEAEKIIKCPRCGSTEDLSIIGKAVVYVSVIVDDKGEAYSQDVEDHTLDNDQVSADPFHEDDPHEDLKLDRIWEVECSHYEPTLNPSVCSWKSSE